METTEDVDRRLALLTPDPNWQPIASTRRAAVDERRAAGRAARLRWSGAAIATAGIIAFVPVTRTFAARCIEACVNATTSVSQLWRADEPEANTPKAIGLTVGDIAPDLAGLTSTGEAARLSSLLGRVVVLNFWATWCGPCKAEIPMLRALQARFRASGLEVIGVSIDDDGWKAVNAFVAEQGIDYRITLADEDTLQAFGGVSEVPLTLVIDRDGRIIIKRVGVLTEGTDYDQIVRLLER
ncbi:MAG TPA: TlpA disulfide reductase family protein [Vicinamibacterales bacterium]|nr:TlpA disulfide reductase family protein [Vicinamibacterales bacterium]